MARWRPSKTQLKAIYSIGADGLGIFVYADTLKSLSRREVIVGAGSPGMWKLTEGGEQLALDYTTCGCRMLTRCDECRTISDIRAARDLDASFKRMEARCGSVV